MSNAMNILLDAGQAAAPDWLGTHRAAGRRAWLAQSLPTRKTENWKYTNLLPIQRDFAPAQPSTAPKTELCLDWPDLGGCRLVFVDGFLREDLSRPALPQGIELVRFSEANDVQVAAINRHLGKAVDSAAHLDAAATDRHLGSAVDSAAHLDAAATDRHLGSAVDGGQHLFAHLNDATLADGVFLAIKPNAVVEAPVQLVWLTTTRQCAFTVNQRLLVLAGNGSKASVVEHFGSAGQGVALTHGITELIVEDGAQLNHCRLHLERDSALHLGGLHALLKRGSTLDSFHLALGCDLKRLDIAVHHWGSGAHCNLNGLYLLDGQEHVDYHSCIEHVASHCSTDEVFRGIVGGEASAVFNGRIHIHPGAQKTRAELSNRNLLTSNSAEVNTKPELEIYADDVQCAHGATVARPDPDMLHYLRTRGLSYGQAEGMLSVGFVNEVAQKLSIEPLRDYILTLLAQRLS